MEEATIRNWCCVGFKSNWEVGFDGERGIAILVDARTAVPKFILQFRSIAHGQEKELKLPSFPISLTSEIRFRFCPWCGKNVEEFYRRSLSQLQSPIDLLVE